VAKTRKTKEQAEPESQGRGRPSLGRKTYSIRLLPEIADQIKGLIAKTGVSFSIYIERAVENQLKKDGIK